MDWKALKPGDVVCTCRYKHLKIVSIEDVTELRNDAAEMMTLLLAMVCLPLAALLYVKMKSMAPLIVVDRIVSFADGSTCHAIACLTDPSSCQHPLDS